MSKYVRAIMLPNLSTLLVALMARAVPYEDGFNIQGHNGKSVGWIDILAEDPEVREAHFLKTAEILNAIINDPKKATQPDWSYLKEVQAPAPAESAVMPTRTMKKGEVAVEAKNA